MASEAVLQNAMAILASFIKEQVGLIIGAENEIKKLASIFTKIQAVLDDAQLNHRESKPIQDWLNKLHDAAYTIDDILDECATHYSRSKNVSCCFSAGEIFFRHNIAGRIKRATERLDEIAEEQEKYSLRTLGVQKSSRDLAARQTGSHLNEIDHIYGREDDTEKIVDILVNQAKGNRQITVLPIIGIGGLGKTTLAQLVLKDPRVVEHFGIRPWVCVSDNFDLNSLIKEILESASGNGNASGLTSLDALQQHLGDLLGQKRYLLVLDDVWNEDQMKWFKLRDALSCGSTGSSIIVTTRVQKVAQIMGTLPSYCLDELSEEHCWMLLKHRAFLGFDEDELYPNLVAVGKQIVKKCAGVPLAAETLGGILACKERTEEEWIGVKESEIWDLEQGETDIMPALKLSYHHLPLELRQCFTYCAIFPKGFTISKEKLVRLWVAHGYISSHEKLEAEDVGEKTLDELIVRSLLQISKQENKKIRMHDLHHDLAQSIMDNNASGPGTQLERIFANASSSKIREVNLSKHYIAFPTSRIEMDITSVLKKYHCLRVLRGNGEIKKLPSTIGTLIHLRSLNLSRSQITYLPNSICSLWNLEELNLNYCSKLRGFPKKMRDLKNLRHLHMEECGGMYSTPSRISELKLLRTLSKFRVNYDKGHRLEELENLNLGGKLELWCVDRVKNPVDAKNANLVRKCNLQELTIIWDVSNPYGSPDRDEMILDALQPHLNLERLSLLGFSGRHLSNWMRRSTVPNLVKINLGCCQNLSDLSVVEEFNHLEYLDLDNVSIEYFSQGGNAVNSHFPALKEVKLCNLPRLKGFFKEEVDREVCPKLQKLSARKCPCLVLPPLNTLKELTCDNSSTLALFPKLESLKEFSAIIGEDMKFILGLECLTNLETLKIYGANEQCIPVDGLRGLKSLQILEIWGSETLTCLPKAWLCHMSTLQSIQIAACPEFVDMPEEIKHLHSLKKIQLLDLGKLVCIPEAIKHVQSLEFLNLAMLPSLTSLPDWLGNLTSLCDLSIFQCEKVPSLPDAIQGMKNLQSLGIAGCPDLKRRCEEGKGEDWHKIAHISYRFFPDGMNMNHLVTNFSISDFAYFTDSSRVSLNSSENSYASGPQGDHWSGFKSHIRRLGEEGRQQTQDSLPRDSATESDILQQAISTQLMNGPYTKQAFFLFFFFGRSRRKR